MLDSQPWTWDLTGLPWDEAEPILKSRGLTYETVVTHPPSRPVGAGTLRVVAEQPRPGGVRVVLAYRTYERPSVAGDPEDQGGIKGRA